MTRTTIALVVLMALAGGLAVAEAGQIYKLNCDACGLQTSFALGGGMRFAQATGWCDTCSAYRSLTWKRDGPNPYANARTYPCPKCAGSFVALRSAGDVRRCPRCTRRRVRLIPWILYD